jgi:hypothetical protein
MQNRNFRDFGSFSVGRKRRNCPSAGFASAADAIGSAIGTCSGIGVWIDDELYFGTVTG